MKKILFTITIILTGIFFIGNVSAAVVYEDRLDIDYNITFNNYSNLNKEVYYQYNNANLSYSINNAFSSLIEEFKKQTKYDSYFIFSGDKPDVHMILFNKSSFYNKIDYFMKNNYGLYFVWYQKSYTDYVNRDYEFNMINGTISKHNIGYDLSLQINGKYYYSYNEFLINSYNTSNKISYSSDFYIATNWDDLEFIYIDDKTKYNKDYNTSGSIYKNVYYNDKLLFSNGQSVLKKEPSIEFKNLQKNVLAEQVIGANVDIVMNNIDNDKHLVQYSSKVNNDYYISQGYVEQWTDIEDTSQPFNYSTSINDTIYVRVIDKEKYYDSADKGEELVIDVITSNTFTFTSITELTPYITYNVSVPSECKVSGVELGQVFSRSACQNLTADIHNMNFNKYSLYYVESDSKIEYIDITDTTDRSSWKGLYSTKFTSTYSSDKYVAIIVLDKLRDKVAEVKIIHLDVVDIATAGFQIKFSDSFNNNLKYVDLKLTIYNDNNYKYYYSIDNGFKYIELTDIGLVDEKMTIKKANIKIYQNGNVLIKVVDTDNNVIGIYEHNINYKELGEKYSDKDFGSFVHDIFDFFITPISHIFSLIANFYNTLPQILQFMFGGIFMLALIYYILKFLI